VFEVDHLDVVQGEVVMDEEAKSLEENDVAEAEQPDAVAADDSNEDSVTSGQSALTVVDHPGINFVKLFSSLLKLPKKPVLVSDKFFCSV
jgi:hypothetical protein